MAAAAPIPGSSSHQVRVQITTWNVGNQEPESFQQLVTPILKGQRLESLDVIVLGLQEATYSTARKAQTDIGDFFERILEVLGKGWYVVQTRFLGQMRLGIFAQAALKPFISNVHASVERTGVANVVSNKGGIAIKLDIFQTTFIFVSAHLAAHEGAEHRAERNKDVAEIMKGCFHFSTNHLDAENFADHIFWMGDLNYRMVPSGPEAQGWDEVKSLLEGEKWAELKARDELTQEIIERRVFLGFKEETPQFRPTFKVERTPGFQYSQQRIPAWCDRVLWKSLDTRSEDVRLLSYGALPDVATSDHKPVQALFLVEAPTPRYLKDIPLMKAQAPQDGCVIKVLSAEAWDMPRMDVTSENDCFLVFLNRDLFFSSSRYCTKVKTDDPHPIWFESELPLLVTRFASLDVLSDQCLHVAIVDKDVLADDIIGVASINLGKILRHQRADPLRDYVPYSEELELSFNGLPRGKFKITLELQSQVVST